MECSESLAESNRNCMQAIYSKLKEKTNNSPTQLNEVNE